jgi:AraC family ethanolamine operon transcriptional activator
MDSVSGAGFHVFAVSISDELLAAAARGLGFEIHEEILAREQVVRCPETGGLGELRRFCGDLTGQALLPTPSKPAFTKALHHELPSLILQRFLSAEQQLPISSCRRRAMRLALEAIRDASEPICSVHELCRLTGVGERTLRYCFHEVFGMSPKSYLQSCRLNAVRRKLLHSEGVPVIAETANHLEFWHMGQFAADYRKMFGELPSETVAKAR